MDKIIFHLSWIELLRRQIIESYIHNIMFDLIWNKLPPNTFHVNLILLIPHYRQLTASSPVPFGSGKFSAVFGEYYRFPEARVSRSGSKMGGLWYASVGLYVPGSGTPGWEKVRRMRLLSARGS